MKATNKKPFVIGIAGGSGSGKSTLMKLLAQKLSQNGGLKIPNFKKFKKLVKSC